MRFCLILLLALLIVSCSEQELVSREIPLEAVKMTPETDVSPVKSLSDEYADPIPIEINTAGAEDSAFVDNNNLYFFFTPDVKVPVEKQILDGVTGIYVTDVNTWSEPQRVVLQNRNKLSLDGCEFVTDNKMWFCTVREGYTGIHWFTAEYQDEWANWKEYKFDPEYEVGELHIHENLLYFHSSRPGGKGGLDIWVSKNIDGEWQEPTNLKIMNTERDDGWPAVSPDGNQLWISRDYGLWRSLKVNDQWTEPELIFSPLAGEATIDGSGNVYFTHHYFKDDQMIEADIYVAKKI